MKTQRTNKLKMVDNGQVQNEAYLYLKNGAFNALTIGLLAEKCNSITVLQTNHTYRDMSARKQNKKYLC